MITVVDNEYLKISVIENTTNYITLCFTGGGHAIGGIDIQSEEFISASKAATALFIVDKQRSWGNNIDFSLIKDCVESFGKGKIAHAIGNSMGGYLAILTSKFIDMATVMAIVPQYSVSRQLMPSEARWSEYIDKIERWKYKSIDGCFIDSTKYYILAGSGGDDDKHLEMMPDSENIHKIYFRSPRFMHNVAQALKQDGVLYPVIADCFSGRSGAEIIERNLTASEYGAFIPGMDQT